MLSSIQIDAYVYHPPLPPLPPLSSFYRIEIITIYKCSLRLLERKGLSPSLSTSLSSLSVSCHSFLFQLSVHTLYPYFPILCLPLSPSPFPLSAFVIRWFSLCRIEVIFARLLLFPLYSHCFLLNLSLFTLLRSIKRLNIQFVISCNWLYFPSPIPNGFIDW